MNSPKYHWIFRNILLTVFCKHTWYLRECHMWCCLFLGVSWAWASCSRIGFMEKREYREFVRSSQFVSYCQKCWMMTRWRSRLTGSGNFYIKYPIFSPGFYCLPVLGLGSGVTSWCISKLHVDKLLLINLWLRFGRYRLIRMAILVEELQTVKIRNVQVRNFLLFSGSSHS